MPRSGGWPPYRPGRRAPSPRPPRWLPRSSGTSASARSRSALVTDAGRELLAAHRAGQHPAHVGVQHGMRWPRTRRTRSRWRCSHRPPAGPAALPGRPAPHRRAAPRSPWQRRAGAAPGGGSRAGPTRVPPHRWVPRRGRRGSARSTSRTRRPAAPATTGVCCSMNSETITAHGVASGRRQGRSRACSAYQSRTGRCSSAGPGGWAFIGTISARQAAIWQTGPSRTARTRSALQPRSAPSAHYGDEHGLGQTSAWAPAPARLLGTPKRRARRRAAARLRHQPAHREHRRGRPRLVDQGQHHLRRAAEPRRPR